MATQQLPLDHIVINSRFDTDAAAAVLAGLGFTLTPRGYHTLGSINHLMVFADNYLEIIGLPPDVPVQRRELLDSAVGIDGLVYAVIDADATLATLTQAGFAAHPVQHFSRPLTLDGQQHEAQFSVVRLLPGQFAAGRVYFCHHRTPELVWRKEWQQHANGVSGIVGLTIVSEQPEQTRAHYARLETQDPQFQLEVLSQAALTERIGTFAAIGAERPERFAVVRLRCADTAVVAALAAHLLLPLQRTAGRVLVAIPAFSTVLDFIDAGAP